MLVGDVGTAEEVVQDAFVAMHGSWNRLRDPEKALAYLRQAIVNRSRSALRHRAVVAKYPPAPPPDVPSAEHFAVAATERDADHARRSTRCLAASGKPSCCGTTPISRRPKSPTPSASARAPSRATHPVASAALRTLLENDAMSDRPVRSTPTTQPTTTTARRLREVLAREARAITPSADGLAMIREKIRAQRPSAAATGCARSRSAAPASRPRR